MLYLQLINNLLIGPCEAAKGAHMRQAIVTRINNAGIFLLGFIAGKDSGLKCGLMHGMGTQRGRSRERNERPYEK
ncbi:MAG: hypothetical protein D4S01_08230 [Dehalococcoidia bacterium]|nr:MAG: hypothetical protein D4S01_08230 [Dehalococcoidia bacterium]